MNRIVRWMGWAALALACGCVFAGAAHAAIKEFDHWPEGTSPEAIGGRLVEHFLSRPHSLFGGPGTPSQITYPDVCAWYGALGFARQTENKELGDRLEARFAPLFDKDKRLLPPPNHVDNSVFGALPLELYLQTGDRKYLELGKRYADEQWAKPTGAQATAQALEYFNKGYTWQTRLWIDDMFMITMVQAQAWRATHDLKYIERAAAEMAYYLEELQRPNGLFYHAPDVPFFWGRGNGWMAAGMAELLRSLPADNPHRPQIMRGYRKMMAALLNYQGEDGMWRQLIDDPASWPETSCTAMFTFAMITGVKNGWLPEQDYAPAARKAWLRLITYLNPNGAIREVCAGTNKQNDRRHYLNRPRIVGDLHGQAPMIWCAAALLRPPDSAAAARKEAPAAWKVAHAREIAKVPAGFPVGFALLTHGNRQYVAYYDQDRRMTVAARDLDSDQWQYQALPSSVGWDSHNYIAMAVDRDGCLHLSGNMHVAPLMYFRTEKPDDIATFKKIDAMVGRDENRCTYPNFMRDAEGRLVFHYRVGSSGNGNEIYNVYDPDTRTWSRLLDKPLTDGKGKMNAYMQGPVKGPDGWFHMVWVWRDTPDCATNHHLSYARSRDLIHWESAGGKKVALPITMEDSSLWVDPIPSGGGIINGGHRLAFDRENRPVIAYHKSDSAGNMQIYITRFEDGTWEIHPLTQWEKPVPFSGYGSMPFIGIHLGALEKAAPDIFALSYRHKDYGHDRIFIDESTLQPVDRRIAIPSEVPPELYRVESDFPGMGIQRSDDRGDSGNEDVRYILQWETLPPNQDRPREGPLPEPSTLRVYKLERT